MAEAATTAVVAGAVAETCPCGVILGMVSSPVFAVAVLGGIIAYEWWKGAKDARQLQPAESKAEPAAAGEAAAAA